VYMPVCLCLAVGEGRDVREQPAKRHKTRTLFLPCPSPEEFRSSTRQKYIQLTQQRWSKLRHKNNLNAHRLPRSCFD
jgi:hypothetical protein